MYEMKVFKYVMQFWFSVLSVIVLVPVFSVIYTGGIQFPGIFTDMFSGFVIANIAGLIIPVQPMAEKFAKLFRAKNGTFAYTLLTSLVFCSVYVVLFALLYTALAIGFPPYYFSAVLKGIPLGFAVSYVISFAVNPLAMKLSVWTYRKVQKKNEGKATSVFAPPKNQRELYKSILHERKNPEYPIESVLMQITDRKLLRKLFNDKKCGFKHEVLARYRDLYHDTRDLFA
ncbi:MAG: DUF2798 domain-containing protein [Clostridiales bacterium]|jgi:glycosyltransferase involved in cell wall biosynthesis|nr:DUF2798 domain-containing protein [Clostridiales bacterium]